MNVNKQKIIDLGMQENRILRCYSMQAHVNYLTGKDNLPRTHECKITKVFDLGMLESQSKSFISK